MNVKDLAAQVVSLCSKNGMMLATAESCTGGMISAAITSVPGSSAAFDRAFITYSNEAKAEMLGVPASDIEQYGAVSPQVACSMAEGAVAHSRAAIAVSVTGIAGPGGGTARKPVGLVYIAVCMKDRRTAVRELRLGEGLSPVDRETVRRKSVIAALQFVKETLIGNTAPPG